MEKVLRCGDLMAGCQHVVRGATEEDVLRQAAKHASEAHNIKEVTPDLAAKVKSKIRTE
jgi:predicted small metal-binding protein